MDEIRFLAVVEEDQFHLGYIIKNTKSAGYLQSNGVGIEWNELLMTADLGRIERLYGHKYKIKIESVSESKFKRGEYLW